MEKATLCRFCLKLVGVELLLLGRFLFH
jgi:hypothetical protein